MKVINLSQNYRQINQQSPQVLTNFVPKVEFDLTATEKDSTQDGNDYLVSIFNASHTIPDSFPTEYWNVYKAIKEGNSNFMEIVQLLLPTENMDELNRMIENDQEIDNYIIRPYLSNLKENTILINDDSNQRYNRQMLNNMHREFSSMQNVVVKEEEEEDFI